VGLASGLADLAQANLTEGIDKAVANGSMGATEAMAARTSARILGSALRALGNPDDPQYAFASAFVSSVVNDGLDATRPPAVTPIATPALDDDGNVMPGVVDPSASAEQQLAQLSARLQAQGLSPSDAAAAAQQALDRAGVAAVPPSPPPADANPPQQIVITGQALPRDAQGNRYELGNDGAVIVHRADGAILRIEAQQAQAAGLSAELAAVLALPRGAALPAGVATLITRGASLLSAAAPWTLAAVAAGGLLSGDTPRPLAVELGRDQRYVQHAGQPAGVLQTFDPATGELLWWQTAQGYRDDAGRFQILPEGQRQYVEQPITTPAQPPGNGSPPPLPADNNHPQPGTPGYVAAPPAGPSVETLPAAPPTTANDLIIERRNSEILGDNLRAAGRPPPIGANGEEIAGYDPHHILPSGKWSELDRLRQRFADWGIDLNDAANGVWLPGSQAPADATGSYHERLHNGEYRDAIAEAFRGITTRDKALDKLVEIRQQLENGTFPGT
jgi:A nuclease family of the HNH/ENDO VII superfamily with conserved AHH